MPASTDLSVIAFLRLRERFFYASGKPRPFQLRDKRNTQDDPLDEFLSMKVFKGLAGVAVCAVARPLNHTGHGALQLRQEARPADDLGQVLGIEVKKLDRVGKNKAVARASGLDFNTTPPCGKIRVYDRAEEPVEIRGFYLFVCVEPDKSSASNRSILSALALVDGNVLNEDFSLYQEITGKRKKRIGLGTFKDGADRMRPMLIFANPLGIPELDKAATLIHGDHTLCSSNSSLTEVYRLKRTVTKGEYRTFSCYRRAGDNPKQPPRELKDPFPLPDRNTQTQPRGRFILPFTF